MWDRCHKWHGQFLCVACDGPERGQATQRQIWQEAEQHIGRGKGIGVAFEEGAEIICDMTAKKIDPPLLHGLIHELAMLPVKENNFPGGLYDKHSMIKSTFVNQSLSYTLLTSTISSISTGKNLPLTLTIAKLSLRIH